jgi:ribosome biogenesis protein UTP30
MNSGGFHSRAVWQGLDGLCRAARNSFTAEQCAENIAAVIEGALEHIPRKWSNVQALHLRTAESAALPIYQVCY